MIDVYLVDEPREGIQDPWEEVFERWGKAVGKIVGQNYSADNTTTVAKFPYARLLLTGAPTADMDLYGNETAIQPAFTVESFAMGNGALTLARKIDAASHAAMISMGYRRTYGPSVIENIDSNIKRIVSRYVGLHT